jgi:hypothetical protein
MTFEKLAAMGFAVFFLYSGDIKAQADVRVIAVHETPSPLGYQADPDWLSVLENQAEELQKSGKAEEIFRQYAEKIQSQLENYQPQRALPMAARSKTVRLATKLTDEQATNRLFQGFERHYLFFDGTSDVQKKFAVSLRRAWPGVLSVPRFVLVAGNRREAASLLKSRVYVDQGASLTKRLQLQTLPAVVRLLPREIVIWSPALDFEGKPDEALPSKVLDDVSNLEIQ